MTESKLEKYIKTDVQSKKAQEVHLEVLNPVLGLRSYENFGRHDFVFTWATMVYVRAGLRHGPLNFKKVNDPNKPILYNDLTFTSKYERKT